MPWRQRLTWFHSLIFCLTLASPNVIQTLAEESVCTPDFQAGSCLCTMANGEGTIDLTPYEQHILTATDSKNEWSYDLTFCRKLLNKPSLPDCFDTASVCLWAAWSPNVNQNIGEPGTTTFEMRGTYSDPQQRLAMVTQTTNKTQGSRTVAFLICDSSASTPALDAFQYEGDQDKDGYLLFYLRVRTAAVCFGGGGGLSGGSILLIIFFCLLFVYFAGGFLYLTFVDKRNGVERIPHFAFWLELPFLARDGVLFAYHQLFRCGSGHKELA